MPEKYSFDEYFLQAFQQQLQRNQEQDEFNRKMAAEERQNEFLNAYHNSILGIQRQQLGLEQQQENRLGEQQAITKEMTEYGITSDYQQVPPNAGGVSGTELNKQFNNILNPFGAEQFYLPKGESNIRKGAELIPMYEGKAERTFEYNPTTGEKWITGYGNEYKPFKPDSDSDKEKNINPEKWKEFGKNLTQIKQKYLFDKDGKPIEVTPELREQMKTEARDEAYNNMLPGAYRWYKKNIKDLGGEDYSNEYLLSKVKYGLSKDELTPEEAQDLIDFSGYREELFIPYTTNAGQ